MTKTQSIAMAAALLFSSTAWAGALTIPNTFTAGTPAVAAQVNANFTAAKTAVDDNNTRITANAAAAATNATNIAANVTNITALQNAKPGYAKAVGSVSGVQRLSLTTGKAFVTLTINAPAAGFAVVTGTADADIRHVKGTLSSFEMRISTVAGQVISSSASLFDIGYFNIQSFQQTGNYLSRVYTSSVIPVVAGANIIYLNAISGSGTNNYIGRPKLTAIYVPNAY